MRRIEIDREELRRLVEDEKLQQTKIAVLLGVDRATIYRRCYQWNLQTQRTGPRDGEEHPNWQGGTKVVGGYRYVYQPDHPQATKQRCVLEHRLVMEATLGRYLHSDEVVHHLNKDRLDNRPENLGLFANNAEHLRHELSGQTPNWSEEGRQNILEGLERGRKKLAERVAARKAAEDDLPRTPGNSRSQAIS